MWKKIPLLLLCFVITAHFNKSFATHIPGANITYTCDPANPLTYTFTLTLFRVCPGTHPATMAASYFSLTNSCGLANPIVPTFNQVGVAEDVNQLCSTATSDCSGGTDPGLWKYEYEATITLPADCDSWIIDFDLCCRDQSSNLTGGTSNNMYTMTTMNTFTSPCNDSPVVTANPIPYACANTTFNYCLTTADPQGDSTVFTMIDPMGANGVPIVFNAGFSAASPLNNFTLDPQTGCISFNHPNIGNYVINMQIDSYDSNGNLITSIVHDFQIIVMACTNTPPANPAGGLTNFSGTGTQLGPNTIGACYGDNVCFDVTFEDPINPTDNITIQQDGTSLLPGATFVQTGTNPATGTFCWVAQPGFTGSIITFVAEDDGCPVMGTSGFAVDFNIATGVYAGPDPIICGAQSTVLSANGANNFTWSPATGLSCTNCPNPVATPAATTTYTLTGDLVGTCPNVDQVTVNVVADFPLTITPVSATICANEVVQLDASGPPASGPYTYTWSPSATLNNNLIGNPLANPLVTTIYTATLTAANGCTKQATSTITVSGVGPTVSIVPSTIDICEGESVPLVSTSYVYPVLCGLSAGCTGTNSTVDVGTATTATSSYTPFYGSTIVTTNYTNKTQFIYTAAELNALGYFGGTIESLGLYFTSSYAYQFDNVDIWIGCTSQDEFLSTSFTPVGGMTLVYTANNVDPTNAGWHTFDIADWDWDGSSNLIIQMCADENETFDAGSELVWYSTTSPAYRCMYYHSAVVTTPACTEGLGSRVTNRPNMRFNMCVQGVTTPTYSWTPSTGLSSASVANPTATPSTTTSYVLNVTANGCTGSGVANINVSPDYTINPLATSTSICYGTSTTLSTNPGGAGPYTYTWSPGGAFTDPTVANPTVTPTGPTTYYISTSNGFCTKMDSITIDVAGLPASVIASADTICPGTPVNLTSISAAATCGVNFSNCTGTLSTAVSATGITATSTYGPFYGSTAVSSYTNKKQYIFTVDELTTMGFGAGTITELAMEVSTSTGRSYNDLEIWIGCTSESEFTSTTYIPTASLSQVYYNPYYTTSLGWNAFDITGFDWDGISNIVIQFCAENQDNTGSENIYYTTTAPFYKCMYYQSNTINSCANATGTRTTVRPNMRFEMCLNSFGAGSTYSWSPAANLSDPTDPNPVATAYGNTTYTLTVTDPANPSCTSTANVVVSIDPSNSVVASNDTSVCAGDPAFLDAVFTGPVPTAIPCGMNVGGCAGASTTADVGSGVSSTSTYSPFYGSYNDYKTQFLYTAAELTAMGLQSGTITEIGFNVSTQFTTGAFQDFTIRMGCTNITTFVVANGWEPTAGVVWGPTAYSSVVGWNNFVLTTGFDWDGVSNIVIETCFNNNAVVSYANAYYTTTPGFNTIMRNYSSANGNVDGCNLAPGFVYAAHPNLRFTVCDPPAVSPTYSWTPAATLSDPSIVNPVATPAAMTEYLITVTGGVCTVYDTVIVNMCNPLAIELVSFTGQNFDTMNELEWVTESETNNDYFTLQRSIDGVGFITIETVDGAGNSNEVQSYRVLDKTPIDGVNYYRLKQTDFDGASSYSQIVALNTHRGNGIQLYPNPTSNDLFIDINDKTDEGEYTILIYDLIGKSLHEQVEFTQNKSTYKVENFRELSSGIYLIQIVNNKGDVMKSQKIIKQ